jgi:LAO/AO transport system kinase
MLQLASPARSELGAVGVTAGVAADRPRPKRPEILVTAASTGAGVPELLAALDRHRATIRAAQAAHGPMDGARRSRAEAQVRAVLADRIADRLRDPGLSHATKTIVEAVADHEIDPFAAADRLLAMLAREPDR